MVLQYSKNFSIPLSTPSHPVFRGPQRRHILSSAVLNTIPPNEKAVVANVTGRLNNRLNNLLLSSAYVRRATCDAALISSSYHAQQLSTNVGQLYDRPPHVCPKFCFPPSNCHVTLPLPSLTCMLHSCQSL